MKKTKSELKFSKVMREFYAGTLKSSSGQKVTSRQQAIAIAASEAKLPPPKRKVKPKTTSKKK